jgi:predicted DNA-binding transcriptional regulator AlpA
MEKYLKVQDVAEALQVSERTAYGYMGQMVHLSRPIRVSEVAFREWLRRRTVDPDEVKKAKVVKWSRKAPRPEDYRIPRRRAM